MIELILGMRMPRNTARLPATASISSKRAGNFASRSRIRCLTFAPLAGAEADLGPAARRVYDESGLAIEIGRIIYQRRTELGWSQAELTRRAGMTQPAIARLEAILILPTTRALLRVATALGQPLVITIGEVA